MSPPISRALWEMASGWDCLTKASRDPLPTLPHRLGVPHDIRAQEKLAPSPGSPAQELQGTSFTGHPGAQGGPPVG